MQRRTSRRKPRKSREGTGTSQPRTVYVMTKKNIAAYNLIPIMEFQAPNGFSDACFFYKKSEIVSEMESVLAKCVEDSLI